MSGPSRLLAVVCALTVLGCGEQEPTSVVTLDHQALSGEALSAAIARSMSDSRIARKVRDHLSTSKYVKHRVDFHGMLTSPGTGLLRERIAAELDMESAELLANVRALGPMQFWLDSRAQRLSWRAEPNVVVAAMVPGGPAPTRAFDEKGGALPIASTETAEARLANAPAIFHLTPGKPLALRARPMRTEPGSTVQHPDDGEYGGYQMIITRQGDTVVTQLASKIDRIIQQVRTPADRMVHVLGPLQNGRTYLKSVVTLGEPDWGSLSDPLEMEFRAKVRQRSNGTVMANSNHGILIPNAAQVHVHDALPLTPHVPGPDRYVTVEARENDSWQAMDDYGDATLGYTAWFGSESSTNNWLNQSWQLPNFGGGLPLCGSFGQSAGYGYICGQPFYWSRVNYSFQWNTYSAPPQVAQMTGPTNIHPTLNYEWGVTNFQQVTGTLYYEWYLNDVLVGTSSTWSGTINAPATLNDLRVDVTDSYGGWERVNSWISVNSGSCEPNDPNCYESLRMPLSTPHDKVSRQKRPQRTR